MKLCRYQQIRNKLQLLQSSFGFGEQCFLRGDLRSVVAWQGFQFSPFRDGAANQVIVIRQDDDLLCTFVVQTETLKLFEAIDTE